MVKIRLRRVGAKKQPYYRVVVADSSSPAVGKFIEIIGSYNPRTEPPAIEIDAERTLYWLGQGAQATEAVSRILDKQGLIARAEAVKRGETRPEVHAPKPEPIEEAEELPSEEEAEIEEEEFAEEEEEEEEEEEFADLDFEETEDMDLEEFEDEDDDE